MDCRHPFTELDQVFLSLCDEARLPCHILLNKADKLSNNEKTKVLQKTVSPFIVQIQNCSFQFFSALRYTGLDELKNKLLEWITLSEM